MATSARVLSIVIRVCGGAALLLGLAFWLGYARHLTQMHMWLGIGVVLSLWAQAVLAWISHGRDGLAAFAVVWGAFTWALGLTQNVILPGPSHWIVQVVHLTAGVIAVVIGNLLAGAVAQRRLARAHQPSS